jgi:hypothetical protein
MEMTDILDIQDISAAAGLSDDTVLRRPRKTKFTKMMGNPSEFVFF